MTCTNREIPYGVAGSGGFAATSPATKIPAGGVTVGEYTLVAPPLVAFGFLTITVDISAQPATLTISFDSRGLESVDSVTVDLTTGRIAGSAARRKTTGHRKTGGTRKRAARRSRKN